MSRSFRKTIRWYPAHVRSERARVRYEKKLFRRMVEELCDSDGTPILPHNCGWPMKRGKSWFGGSSYVRWVWQFRIIGGKLVSTRDEPEPFPGYTQRQFRHYRCK